MFQLKSKRASVMAALAAALLIPIPSTAQTPRDRDAREISSYVLTEAGLAKFAQATRNLGGVAKQSTRQCEDDGNAQSLDASVARLDAVSGARTAIRSAGMTTREYLVFTLSVFQSGMAAWALAQPGGKLPPGVSMANVDFYRAHEAAIRKLAVPSASDACEDTTDDRDDDDADR